MIDVVIIVIFVYNNERRIAHPAIGECFSIKHPKIKLFSGENGPQ